MGHGRYLSELREVVNQDIPVAAAAVRALTGPIKIFQGPKSQRRSNGAVWKAIFSPNLPNALLHVAQKNSYPDVLLLEYLCKRIWINPKSVEIAVDHVPKYQRVAQELRADRAAGVPPAVIQRKYHLDGRSYQDAVRFAETGALPPLDKRKRTQKENTGSSGSSRIAKYKQISSEVARLKDKENLSLAEITRRFNESKWVVNKAYELAHPEIVQKSIDERHAICREPNRARLRPDQVSKVKQMLKSECEPAAIMSAVGCSHSTVWRIKKRAERNEQTKRLEKTKAAPKPTKPQYRPASENRRPPKWPELRRG